MGHGWEPVPEAYADNEHILSWWTASHDAVIRAEIDRMGWHYGWYIFDAVERITPPEIIEQWRRADPLCKQYAYYNVIMYFGIARAQTVGLEQFIAPPREIVCAACAEVFDEEQYDHYLVKWVGGRASIRCCAVCSKLVFLEDNADDDVTGPAIADFLAGLADVLQRVPMQNWPHHVDWRNVCDERLRNLVNVCSMVGRPSLAAVKREHGSWLGGLIASGVLADGTHKGRFGTRTVALDSHVCNSLAEKTIDDWLFTHGIAHTREPAYPGSSMRADFEVGGALIEYFGLVGHGEYDEKINLKRQVAKKNDVRLVEIFPDDLVSWETSQRRIARALGVSIDARAAVWPASE